jgi:hypothetical protein
MCGLLKSAVLGAVLLTGTALAAQAQSVTAAPPAGGASVQSVQSHPNGPKPGGGSAWKEQRAQLPADYKTNPRYHPYSTHGMGPQADTPWTGAPPQSGKASPATAPKTN